MRSYQQSMKKFLVSLFLLSNYFAAFPVIPGVLPFRLVAFFSAEFTMCVNSGGIEGKMTVTTFSIFQLPKIGTSKGFTRNQDIPQSHVTAYPRCRATSNEPLSSSFSHLIHLTSSCQTPLIRPCWRSLFNFIKLSKIRMNKIDYALVTLNLSANYQHAACDFQVSELNYKWSFIVWP